MSVQLAKLVFSRMEGEAVYGCPNHNCADQLKGRIEYFASRGCLDIDSLGEAVVSQLVELKMVTNLDDLYRLNASELLKLEGFAEKSANNLVESIRKKPNPGFPGVFYAVWVLSILEQVPQRFGSLFYNWRNCPVLQKTILFLLMESEIYGR